jgi:hypothetical protein
MEQNGDDAKTDDLSNEMWPVNTELPGRIPNHPGEH